jgi:hypothetical protein
MRVSYGRRRVPLVGAEITSRYRGAIDGETSGVVAGATFVGGSTRAGSGRRLSRCTNRFEPPCFVAGVVGFGSTMPVMAGTNPRGACEAELVIGAFGAALTVGGGSCRIGGCGACGFVGGGGPMFGMGDGVGWFPPTFGCAVVDSGVIGT